MIGHHLVPPWTTYGPRRSIPLALALMLSFGIHAAALLLPDRSLPSAEPRPDGSHVSVLEARLRPMLVTSRSVSELVSSPAPDTAATPFRSHTTKRIHVDRRTPPRVPSWGAVSVSSRPGAAESIQANASEAASQRHAPEQPAIADGSGVKDIQVRSNHGDVTEPPEMAAASTPVAYLSNPKPEYPEMARQQEQEGMVVLRVLVTKDGSPAEIKIRKSSGFRTLDRAAVAGVKHWSFTPARQNQQSVDAWMDIPIRFRLSKEGD